MDFAPSTPPMIHEATRERDGIILKGAPLEESAAMDRRQAGDDVVVCGANITANRSMAGRIETGVGPCFSQPPHIRSAGPFALPHFQQVDRSHPGHTFYETPRRKARKP